MTDERLKQQLEFVLEIDKEKNIFRADSSDGSFFFFIGHDFVLCRSFMRDVGVTSPRL